eukprot:4224658-Lingulodinium_polyedra.AAC.1
MDVEQEGKEGQGPAGASSAEADLEAAMTNDSAADAAEAVSDSGTDQDRAQGQAGVALNAVPGPAASSSSSAPPPGQAPAALGAARSAAEEPIAGHLGAEAEATLVEETRLVDDMPDDEAPAEVRRMLAEQRQLPRCAPGSNQ